MRNGRWSLVCGSLTWLLLVWLSSARATAQVRAADDPLRVTLFRGGVKVHGERPASLLHDITPGDVLTFRIADKNARWAQLNGLEGGAWMTYFHGNVRADQPIPRATVMHRGKISLKLRVCDSAAQSDCEEHVYLL